MVMNGDQVSALDIGKGFSSRYEPFWCQLFPLRIDAAHKADDPMKNENATPLQITGNPVYGSIQIHSPSQGINRIDHVKIVCGKTAVRFHGRVDDRWGSYPDCVQIGTGIFKLSGGHVKAPYFFGSMFFCTISGNGRSAADIKNFFPVRAGNNCSSSSEGTRQP